MADGKVFVATYGDNEPKQIYGGNNRPAAFPKYYVAVYGLLNAPAAPAPIVNQDRDDVTVVRASTSPLNLNMAACTPIDASSVDCTSSLEQAAGAPSLHRVILAAGQDPEGCALLRVTTVSDDAALANAAGIGFWSAQGAEGNVAPENSGRFLLKAALKPMGAATLQRGSPATLHEFAGLTNCALGQESSMERLFKPYLQFERASDGTILRNWDRAENYRVSRDRAGFDRSSEVLR